MNKSTPTRKQKSQQITDKLLERRAKKLALRMKRKADELDDEPIVEQKKKKARKTVRDEEEGHSREDSEPDIQEEVIVHQPMQEQKIVEVPRVYQSAPIVNELPIRKNVLEQPKLVRYVQTPELRRRTITRPPAEYESIVYVEQAPLVTAPPPYVAPISTPKKSSKLTYVAFGAIMALLIFVVYAFVSSQAPNVIRRPNVRKISLGQEYEEPSVEADLEQVALKVNPDMIDILMHFKQNFKQYVKLNHLTDKFILKLKEAADEKDIKSLSQNGEEKNTVEV